MKNLKLPSGKNISANLGFIGISDDGYTCTGYDSGLYIPTLEEDDWTADVRRYSAQDACDLADIMIARWQAFKAKHSQAEK